ncbi:serine/threonine-protein kinase [Lentzea flaviverrucosa]|uniref:non-specific serine/threonine protein kinase n=1 Tax=Lentzea flaviverrucosa TaxID=200379 RepID=A0A1H9M7M1_9PSEU|nr:serine/threonine-protein kinase [Lentzea flaviverrucosa]RDI31043.1 serine/threonine protein kinase [Lentzea flaviverrucosa]SER19622.1 Serine/threonine protein kinase [Lentzea flaviverrucosa]
MGLAESLLTWLHGFVGASVCPGDWVWTTTALGAVLGLFPTIGALLSIAVRRVVGNSYGPVTGAIFTVLGVASCLVLPWLVMRGTVQGLSGRAIPGSASLDQDTCFGTFSQGSYLVDGAPSIIGVIQRPTEQPLFLAAAGITAALALLCLLFVMLQSGSAFRLGPNWPRRVFWPMFLVLLVTTSAFPVTLVGHVLLGFLPIAIIGSLVVRIFGLTTAMLNRPGRDRSQDRNSQNSPPPQPVARKPQPQNNQLPAGQPQKKAATKPITAAQHQPPPQNPGQNPPPYQPAQVPKYQPAPMNRPMRPVTQPQHQPPRQYPPTRVAEVLPQPSTPQPSNPAVLADTPGPLPFGPGAANAESPAPVQKSGKVWNPGNGRFRRVRQLGSGGFGTVWLAVDEQLDRTVAVKLAHAPDNDTEARMLREARALAAVRHPNCVRVFDIVQDPDGLALVMEYIEGASLSETVLKNGLIDDKLAARLWLNMADALAAAHDRGVLHRDVKPSNVIVDNQGTAHLIDFGIARSKGDSTLTATGMMVGTPDFLAPETARGETASPASDSWQLAATVSYALTGHPPRGSRENPISSLMAAAQGEPITKLPQNSKHARLLLAAMDPEPGRRPSLAQVRGQLSQFLDQQGMSKEGPVTKMISKPTPPPTRHMPM